MPRRTVWVRLSVLIGSLFWLHAAKAEDALLDPYPPLKKPPVMRQDQTDPNHGRGMSGFVLPPAKNRTGIPRQKSVMLARYYKPFWQAGEYDGKLTDLCRTGYFHEDISGRWVIKYDDRQGQATLGVAAVGYNLVDMTGAAERGSFYLFYQSGETRCRVYRWTEDWPPQPDIPPDTKSPAG